MSLGSYPMCLLLTRSKNQPTTLDTSTYTISQLNILWCIECICARHFMCRIQHAPYPKDQRTKPQPYTQQHTIYVYLINCVIRSVYMQEGSWVIPNMHLINKINEPTHNPIHNHIQYICMRLIVLYGVDTCKAGHGLYKTCTLPTRSKNLLINLDPSTYIYLYLIICGVWSEYMQDGS